MSARNPLARRSNRNRPAVIELLETRAMLSAAVSATVQPDYTRLATPADDPSTTIEGYTPAQIRTAYGFGSASFSDGSIAADGAGQTIAIIDAFNDQNIVSDLAYFDTQFDIAAPASFKIVNQAGGSKLPANNADWAGEIALDVEWAHAIAPGANLLLVEATSDDTDDLMAAVNYARNAAGVSVVSMSWGGSEYVDWGNGGESDSQTSLDPDFTTPAGHEGVTFVAAAGDSGQQSGVQWPASSPNVVAVGGTTLTLDTDGTYESETGWSGTSGGYSQVEGEPTYQDGVQTTGARSVPDVAYDADPNTGFAEYDSVKDNGVVGWQEVGGTSAGTPQWAGLIAIADQGRVIAGKTTLDGKTQTLPALYSLYSAPNTTDHAAYTTDFNDIESGGTGGYHFRYGGPGNNGNEASAGYDDVTGLGSPHAAGVISALSGVSTTGGTGSNSSSGTGSNGSSSPSTLPLSPVAVTLLNTPVTEIMGGKAGSLTVDLTNTGSTTFSGPITLTLYASTDTTVSSDDTVVTTLTIKKLTLGSDKSKTEKMKFDYPSTLPTASYRLIVTAAATETDTTATSCTAVSAVTITQPTVDLSVAFANTVAVPITPGKKGSVAIKIENLGNVTAAGKYTLNLYASTDGTIDLTAVLLTALTNRKLSIGAGKTSTIHVSFKAIEDLLGGTFDLIASLSSTSNPSDGHPANNTAVTSTQPA
jgi:subtilase family serine protease